MYNGFIVLYLICHATKMYKKVPKGMCKCIYKQWIYSSIEINNLLNLDITLLYGEVRTF